MAAQWIALAASLIVLALSLFLAWNAFFRREWFWYPSLLVRLIFGLVGVLLAIILVLSLAD